MKPARLALPFAIACALAPAAPVHAATPIDRSIPADADARVEVANVRGSIEVVAWDEPQVVLSGTLGEGSELKVEGSGARIVARIETPDGKGWGWWGRSGPAADTRLVVKVPRAATLEVDAVSADVRIDGLAGSREISVETVSGDLRVQAQVERLEVSSVSGDVEFGGGAQRAQLETVSGDLVASGVGGEVDVETVSGDARVAAGEVDRVGASTVSGSVDLDLTPRGSATIRAETMSGELRLRLPASLSANIEAETFSGSIRSDFGTVRTEEHGPGESLDAKVGDGAARIDLESFSGDVEIRKR
jgi:hypothetical protein